METADLTGAPPSPLPAPATAVATAFAALPAVVAVAAAGSSAVGAADDRSDVDLYVYAAAPIPLAHRAAIAAGFATYRELGNRGREPGDTWVDAETARRVDITYRTPRWTEDALGRVLVRHEASVGYSTCLWHNVLHSVPLCDPTGWFRALQGRAAQPYPPALRRAIVATNHPLLRRTLSSYVRQLEQAVRRGDSVSVQHRTTALLASYFDILFAVNELPHPGEKRLLQTATTRCPKIPPELEQRLAALLRLAPAPPHAGLVQRAGDLVDGLDGLLVREGLLAPDGAGDLGELGPMFLPAPHASAERAPLAAIAKGCARGRRESGQVDQN